MPPGKRRQSNAMLYTLVIFVSLFIVATTVAVIYYVKAEDLRTKKADAEDELRKMASVDEVRHVGEIVGEKAPGQRSYLGSMNEYLDEVVGLVTGKPVQATTAQVKVSSTLSAVRPLLAQTQAYIGLPATKPADANAAEPNSPAVAATEPNRVSLTALIKSLLVALETTTKQKDHLEQLRTALQADFNDATTQWAKTKEDLKMEVEKYRQDIEKTKADYAALRDQLNQKSQEQTAGIETKLKDEQAQAQQLRDDLAKTQAELKVAQEKLKSANTELAKVQAAPESQVAAQTPDGKIILVNNTGGIVYINLGSEDRVYPGLTFSVYDRFSGIPKDGKPKAEIEVFAVDSRVCSARVLSSDSRDPIATGDLVANLIWDSHKQNQFVLAGDFDLDGNGKPDPDAMDKIRALIEKWGGTVKDAVSSKTDFVIIGDAPDVPPQPTAAALQVDPTARDKYEAAQKGLERYNQIRQQASSLSIPVLTYERFLYFIGYKTASTKPGAF